MIKPRIRSLPAALGSLGDELVSTAQMLGYTPDPWQRLAFNDILATDEAGEIAAFEAVVVAGRQNGKSLIGEVYGVHFALQGETVFYTSHRADASKEIFRRLLVTLPDSLEAKPTFTNGKEQIAFPSGGVLFFRTRGPRVGRTFSVDKVIVDECQICDKEHLDALVPTTRTKPQAQVLYLGCAPDARSNANCEVISELRERGRRGDSNALCYLEWSAGFFDGEGNELQAHELTEAMLADESKWPPAVPASESGRITFERMRVEHEALDASTFAVEYLTVGVYASGAGASGPITQEAWDSLADPASQIHMGSHEIPSVIVSADVAPDRQVSVCLVGRRDDDLWHVDLVGRFGGIPAAVRAIAALYERDDIDVRFIVCDGEPANLDLLGRLRHEYVAEKVLCTENAARVGPQACGTLVDLVAAERFRHTGQIELSEALRGGVVKTFADSWMYSRSRSRSDVSPLIAAAVALWKAEVEIERVGEQGPHIH